MLLIYTTGIYFPIRVLGFGQLVILLKLLFCAEDTKIGGASAGSLIAACYHSGIGTKAATDACLLLAAELRNNGTRGRLKVSFSTSNTSFTYSLHSSLLLQTDCVTKLTLYAILCIRPCVIDLMVSSCTFMRQAAHVHPGINSMHAHKLVLHIVCLLQSNLRIFLEDLLPADVHERCTNKAYVSLCAGFWWFVTYMALFNAAAENELVIPADICDTSISSPKKYVIVGIRVKGEFIPVIPG